MTFADLLGRIARGVEAGDGALVASAFTPDGVYRDVFYGPFRGAPAITDLVEGHMHRDGADFRWDMIDPVEADGRGYARYVFSYRSRREGAGPGRAIFEGVAIARMKGGLIADYDEIANAAVGLSMLGTEDARLARFVARQSRELKAAPYAARHLGEGGA